MTSLICGSVAFDTIMSFHGRFSEALLADQLHNINVAFLVPEVRREFGGCAGNIAYNLKLLGGDPLIMATIGQDGTSYLERLAALGISSRNVRTIESSYTAQAFITTDADNNQITAFHPGAMMLSHQNRIADAGPVKLAIVAPDGRAGMLYGLTNDLDWPTTGRLASLMGAIKIAHQGGQNHAPSQTEIADRFHAAFGYRY